MTHLTDMRTLSSICSLAATAVFLAACEPVRPATSGAPADVVEGPTVTALPVISASDMPTPATESTEQSTSEPAATELNDDTIPETAPAEETESVNPSVDETATSQDDEPETVSTETDGDSTSIVDANPAPAAPETDAPADVISEEVIAEETTPESLESEQAEADAPASTPEDSTQQLAMVQPAPPPPPPPPPAELAPATLLGIDQNGLLTRLGAADLLRREGSMEVWQYRLAGCVVDFYIYPAAAGRLVTHWDWRVPTIGQTLDATACRQQLAERDSTSQR